MYKILSQFPTGIYQWDDVSNGSDDWDGRKYELSSGYRIHHYFDRQPFWSHSLGRRLVVVRGVVQTAFVYLLFQLTPYAVNYEIVTLL